MIVGSHALGDVSEYKFTPMASKTESDLVSSLLFYFQMCDPKEVSSLI
jgi:hypothetical protein